MVDIIKIITHCDIKNEKITGAQGSADVFTEAVNEKTEKYIKKICSQKEFKDSNIKFMPNAYVFENEITGMTMKITDSICPSFLGTDIGCGILTLNLGVDEIDLPLIDEVIKRFIPSGDNIHNSVSAPHKKALIEVGLDNLRCIKGIDNLNDIERSFGTLGMGSHYIEILRDESGSNYLSIHTGSRMLGEQVSKYYKKLAFAEHINNTGKDMLNIDDVIRKMKKDENPDGIHDAVVSMKKNEKAGKFSKIQESFCYLKGFKMESFIHDTLICRKFSYLSKILIASTILSEYNLRISNGEEGIKIKFNTEGEYEVTKGNLSQTYDFFEMTHNFFDVESNMLRKGAISSRLGEPMIIPLNMRDGSLLCKGLGSDYWNKSAPCGAGRVMSRRYAKSRVNIDKYQEDMSGIYSTSICKDTIKESPGVYKRLNEVKNEIIDTCEVVAKLKTIYNMKPVPRISCKNK